MGALELSSFSGFNCVYLEVGQRGALKDCTELMTTNLYKTLPQKNYYDILFLPLDSSQLGDGPKI